MNAALGVKQTIDRSENRAVIAGMRTRSNGRYNGNGREWATPPEVFQPLDDEFRFTVDACATRENAKVSRFWTEADDGLSKDWTSERVWLNPPYGREIYSWTKKARTSGAEVVVGLLPASCDLAWWHNDVLPAAEVRYLRGRVRFLTGGPYRASGFFASVIVIWRTL
jgi:site-specific DNA-methyltransferase (adenine-specific)